MLEEVGAWVHEEPWRIMPAHHKSLISKLLSAAQYKQCWALHFNAFQFLKSMWVASWTTTLVLFYMSYRTVWPQRAGHVFDREMILITDCSAFTVDLNARKRLLKEGGCAAAHLCSRPFGICDTNRDGDTLISKQTNLILQLPLEPKWTKIIVV